MNVIGAASLSTHDLSRSVEGLDQDGLAIETCVAQERAQTLYVNGRQIVTLMTIGDHPELLAMGYLFNQGMIQHVQDIESIHYDGDVEVISVRIAADAAMVEKLKSVTITSGCAQGTMFGNMLDIFERLVLPTGQTLKTSWLAVLLKRINTMPSIYLKTGAIHGCVLCHHDLPLAYMEDVGRHNAVDKISGYMLHHNMAGDDKILYTTGRLTSEMVIKCVTMGIPILISRSGFTAMGVDLARKAGLTLIGRAKGKRHMVLSGVERIVRDGQGEG